MIEQEISSFQDKINQLGDWYQPIEFIPGKLRTNSRYSFFSTIHGINKWNFILRRNLPQNLKGKTILDIGCASGLYTLLCAQQGARVVGVELDQEGYKQSLLTRDIFSAIDRKDYKETVEIINTDFMNFEWEKYGQFDAVIALNVLYWIRTPYEKIAETDVRNYTNQHLNTLIEKVKEHTKLFVVQADENKYWVRRKKNGSLEATNAYMVQKLLKQHGFTNISIDKPLAFRSLLRTLTSGTLEIDTHHPLYYARPIIKATSC